MLLLWPFSNPFVAKRPVRNTVTVEGWTKVVSYFPGLGVCSSGKQKKKKKHASAVDATGAEKEERRQTTKQLNYLFMTYSN